MKIFGGSELVNEQNQRIRQLLGEGTGGMRAAAVQPVASNWKDIVKQNIHNIAASNKQASPNLTYLDRFKESLDSRIMKGKPQESITFERLTRSRSENRNASRNRKNESAAKKVDITTSQLLSTRRRFSESKAFSRPKSVQPSSTMIRSLGTTSTRLRTSKVIDSLQNLRTSNLGHATSLLDDLRQKQKSERMIESATKSRLGNRGDTERFSNTPTQWRNESLSRSNINSSVKTSFVDQDIKPNHNFRTPKTILFSKRRDGATQQPKGKIAIIRSRLFTYEERLQDQERPV